MTIDTQAMVALVQRAGAAILEIYDTDFDVVDKSDASPLTQADLAAHRILVASLAENYPDIPIMSEEGDLPSLAERSGWHQYWLVDPLDGTKEFVNRNGEFTVNVALIEAGVPVWGIVGVPVQQRVFVGNVKQGQAHLYDADGVREIHSRKLADPPRELNVVASRSHGGERLEQYIDALKNKVDALSRTPVGSSLKLCTLAVGEADFYPRLGPTSEWDIGAAHAVLRAAGGEVYTFDDQVLGYNRGDGVLNPDFYAVADRKFGWAQWLPAYPPAESH